MAKSYYKTPYYSTSTTLSRWYLIYPKNKMPVAGRSKLKGPYSYIVEVGYTSFRENLTKLIFWGNLRLILVGNRP